VTAPATALTTALTTAPAPAPVPPGGVGARPASDFDALVARTAARLRAACRPMPAAAFDALVHDVVLDAARFALRWADE
jgi:hypothetical protein